MNDLYLIAGVRKRDKLVFDYIFNYYYSSLCVFSLQFVQDGNIAEDLVQDFFVSLWAEGPRLEIKSSLKAYLFSGVKNRCLDFQKRRKVVEKYQKFAFLTAVQVNNTTEQYFAESELRQVVEKSMNKLSPRCREIFEMSRINGLTNQEISEKLSISKRTVELQISNSLRIIRKELIEFLPLYLILWLVG